MRANVKAWQDIYNEKELVSDVERLRAFGCILFGPVRIIKELTTDVVDKMVEEFEKLYPEFRYDHLEIQTVEEKEYDRTRD